MGTIQKRADELKPGDVVITESSRLVVTQTDEYGFVWVARSGEPYAPLANVKFQKPVDVEAPDLTPAQQHAEELASALMDCLEVLPRGTAVALRALELLEKVIPPKPPTLEEALDLVAVLANGHSASGQQKALDMLDRARRAGVLK